MPDTRADEIPLSTRERNAKRVVCPEVNYFRTAIVLGLSRAKENEFFRLPFSTRRHEQKPNKVVVLKRKVLALSDLLMKKLLVNHVLIALRPSITTEHARIKVLCKASRSNYPD